MRKTIRKFISEKVRNIAFAGMGGGALILILAVIGLITKSNGLLIGVVVAAVLTAAASAALWMMMTKKINESVCAPVEQIAGGSLAKLEGDIPQEIHDAASAVIFAAEGRLAAGDYIARIAEGDFTADIPEELKADEMGQNFERLSENLSRALENIYEGAQAVNTNGEQVSGASVSLSRGAAEQADTLGELSRSVIQIKGAVIKNAENAHEANRIVEEAAAELETGTAYMKALVDAMDNINKSTEEISNFVRVIEDIAFQTNILALNSSVEAARAGEAGKGFAVVAMEVKNLATRSQEAAQETTAVIEECVRNVRAGLGKTEQTAKSITAVAAETKEISRLIGIISNACDEQSESILKIDSGVERINSVVKNTNSAAQECVESAKQLAARSGRLKSEIGSFRFKTGNAKTIDSPFDFAPTPVNIPVVEPASAPAVEEKKAEAPKKDEVSDAPSRKSIFSAAKAKKPEPVIEEPVKEAEKDETVYAVGKITAESYANAEFVETPDNKY